MHQEHGDVIVDLNVLIAYERAAVDACEAAAGCTGNIEQRARLRELVRDHLRNVEDLSRCVVDLGGAPTHAKRALPRESAEIRGLPADRLLLAVLDDEAQVAQAYGHVLDRDTAARVERVLKLVRRAAQQHVRRQAWLRALVPRATS